VGADPEMPTVSLPLGEKLIHAWPADLVGDGKTRDVHGWLALTSHRLLFARGGGVWGGRRMALPPLWEVPLRHIRTVAPRSFAMAIGYGEQIPIPGLAVDGRSFRLNREQPVSDVLGAIEEARPPDRLLP
jgi:hypothetical protein